MEQPLIIVFVAVGAFLLGFLPIYARYEQLQRRFDANDVQHGRLRTLFDASLRDLRDDTVLLPSLARWAARIQEERDDKEAKYLETKKWPAWKAAQHVREARAEARQARKELNVAFNHVDLYEALAPWLLEYTKWSLDELIEAMRDDEKAKASAERGEDPARQYVPNPEWRKLSTSERNQLALDRYCDPKRKRTPWAAGVQYERYVGYRYEKSGFSVKYYGALRGRKDLGIDLICENEQSTRVVQCKRLSPDKQLPVRENAIAQIFGSAEFYRMCSESTKSVRAILVTTFQLSEEARRFAEHLNVAIEEFFELKPYPMIKCNVSRVDGEKIYHLPMDQQYDNVIVGDREGEFYAWTVKEAEHAGFRRAFRWKGSASSATDS